MVLNDDNMCAIRAILISTAYSTNHVNKSKYTKLSCQELDFKVNKLATELGKIIFKRFNYILVIEG